MGKGKLSEGALSELMGLVRENQRLKDQIKDLNKDRAETGKAIEMILRAHNMFEVPLADMELKVKLKTNTESRRMKYKDLMTDHSDLYNKLVELGLLTISPPKKMYELRIDSMKNK